MTDKQKAFVDAYLADKDMNATRAYKKIYINVKSDEAARKNASRLLTNADVKEYLEQRMAERRKRTEITQDKVLQELADLFNTKVTDIVNITEEPIIKDDKFVIDPDTNQVKKYQKIDIKPTNTLPISAQKAITSIKQGRYGIEIGIVDKTRIIELIGKHLGMFKEKVEVSGKLDNPFEGLTTEQLLKLAGGKDGS